MHRRRSRWGAFVLILRGEWALITYENRSSNICDGVQGLVGELRTFNRNPTCWRHDEGNTPIVRIKSLSDLTGVEILVCHFVNWSWSNSFPSHHQGKAEVSLVLPFSIATIWHIRQFLNPGGSVKDRVSLESDCLSFPPEGPVSYEYANSHSASWRRWSSTSSYGKLYLWRNSRFNRDFDSYCTSLFFSSRLERQSCW